MHRMRIGNFPEAASGPQGAQSAMQFGLFGSAQANGSTLGAGVGQGFHDFVDFCVAAEGLGYRSSFLVEHHFTGWGQVSATLNLLTWLAARTTTLRLGTATMVLPWHHPLLLAEQAATLQLLSRGRLDLGVGKGYRHSEFQGFGIAPEEAQARFDECLDLLQQSWRSKERFSHQGRFWNFHDVVVEPHAPEPPALWMGAGSEPSIRAVAGRGFRLLLDQFADAAAIGGRIRLYASALAEAGHRFDPLHVAVARDLCIVDSEEEKRAAIERLNQGRQRTIEVARAPQQTAGSHILSYAAGGQLPPTASALIGTVDEVTHKLRQLSDAGVHYVLLSVLGGSMKTLRRFAEEVMPEMAEQPA